MSATPSQSSADQRPFPGLRPPTRDVADLGDGVDQQPFSGLRLSDPGISDHRSPDPDLAPEEDITPLSEASFRIIGERERHYGNFGLLAREVTVQIDPPQPHDNPYIWLREIFFRLTAQLLNGDDVAPHDRIGFTFHSAARVGQRPIGLSIRRMDQFSTDVILQLIERCVQSNEQFLVAGPMQIVFLHVRVPT
jgi:hypothetical protein